MDDATNEWIVTGSIQNNEKKTIDAVDLDITIDGNAVNGAGHFNLLDIRRDINHTSIAPGDQLSFKARVFIRTEVYASSIYVSIHVYHNGLERDETTLGANTYYA